MNTTPRPIAVADLDWVHSLNEVHAVELSPLTPARLGELIERAFYAKAVDNQAAFMIAFDQDADYDSPNFLWFCEKLPRFVYVDRIAVSAKSRGKGHAGALYRDLFSQARQCGHDRIVCEVNSDPPNQASDAFHEALGFSIMGEARLEDRDKHVRYLIRELS